MIFFQQSAVADKGLTKTDIAAGRLDTALGALLAALAAIAAVLAAAPLHEAHLDAAGLATGADFATALRPHLGAAGASLFALGMVEAGLVAAMTVSTSSSYALAKTFGRDGSLNLDFTSGRWFYGTAILSTLLAAAVVLIPGVPLLAMTLTVNIIATLLMAPALLFLLLLANDAEIMGGLVNGRIAKLVGGAIVIGISLAGAVYGAVTVLQP